MHSFIVGPKIYIGDDAFSEVMKGKKCVFIVTDKFMHESGKVKYVTDVLDALGANYCIFSDIKADPDTEVVVAGMKQLLEHEADCVVALGGGSAIDTAKAIRYFINLNKPIDEQCFFCVLPTTSGTGSEVSSYAVITDTKKQVKYPLEDERLLPDAAVLDANLVLSVPAKTTADTGVDALTHAMEAFVSINHSDCSDAMAEKAIKLIFRNLHEAYVNPSNLQARQALHNASCLAGIAFNNAGLGLNHACAHALGAKFHLPHGRACGLFMPYVMTFAAGCNKDLTGTAERYAELAAVLNLDKSGTRQGALSAIRAVRGLLKRVGIPNSIKDAGIDRREFDEKLDSMLDAALADATIETTPVKPSREDLKALFKAAYNGVY